MATQNGSTQHVRVRNGKMEIPEALIEDAQELANYYKVATVEIWRNMLKLGFLIFTVVKEGGSFYYFEGPGEPQGLEDLKTVVLLLNEGGTTDGDA